MIQSAISIDRPELLLALAGFILVLVIHTGALFYWGGSVTRAIKDHDRRLSDLESE